MAKANITLRILSHLLSVTSLHFVCSCPVARFTAINTPPVRRSQPNTFACFDGGDICRPSFQQQRSLPWICWLRIRGLLLYRLPAILRSTDVAMAGTANWTAVALQLATMDRHSERHVALLRRGCATLRATIDLQIVVGQSRNHFILLFSRQSHITSASGTWRH